MAIVALVTVLPEYAADLYYDFRAGQAPQSDYVHCAAANTTWINRAGIVVPHRRLQMEQSSAKDTEILP